MSHMVERFRCAINPQKGLEPEKKSEPTERNQSYKLISSNINPI